MSDVKKSFLKEALSGNGYASSKRLFGAVVLVVCLGCLIYLMLTEGGTEIVKDIITTFILVACALLGLDTITNAASAIFGGKAHKKNAANEDV